MHAYLIDDSGSVEPRWHVQQVTRMWPLKLSVLICRAIKIIFRAVCFSGLVILFKRRADVAEVAPHAQ